MNTRHSLQPLCRLVCVPFNRSSLHYWLLLLLLVGSGLTVAHRAGWRLSTVSAELSQSAATVVSAASYVAPVAPDSIAVAFGARLATKVVIAPDDADPGLPGIQLPTELGGTTVEINGRRAGLFFVSPNQVNFVTPAGTAAGVATISVRGGDGAVSSGTVRVEPVAPAIFTASANGRGVAVGLLLRVLTNNQLIYEPIAQFNPATSTYEAIPLAPKTTGERLFLVLFLTGVRGAADPNRGNNANETVHLLLGGQEIVPDYVGPQGVFLGLDQLNAEIPPSMLGRGLVDVVVNYSTIAYSNIAQIRIGGPPPPDLALNSLSGEPLLVGQEFVINGSGFSTNAGETEAYVVGDGEPPYAIKQFNSLTATQIKAVLPFSAPSGYVRVKVRQREVASPGRLKVRTSVSGQVIDNAANSPIPGVVVRAQGTNLMTTTNLNGEYVLPDMSPGLAQIQINSSPSSLPLPYPSVLIKKNVKPGRDNHIETSPITRQSSIGLPFGGAALLAEDESETAAVPTARAIQTDGITFEVADNTTAVFPGGGSAGAATVSTDGKTVETATNAVTETSIFFVAVPRPVTRVLGQVVDSDGATPVREAAVRTRGQEVFTDATGLFVLLDVPVKDASDLLTLEASYQRPTGRVDRVTRTGVTPVPNGVTRVAPDLKLPSVVTDPNRPPTLLLPTALMVAEGATLDTPFIASDPDTGQTITVTVTSTPPAPFASIGLSSNAYTLRLAPGAGTAGNYTLVVKATDNGTPPLSAMQNVAVTITSRVTSPFTTKAPMPTPRNHAVSGVINGLLYVAGGLNGATDTELSVLEVYDPAANSWTTRAPMPTPRHGAASAVINGKLYVAGGATLVGNQFLNVLEMYDPVTNLWSTKKPMPTARGVTGFAVIDGKFYVAGGGIRVGNTFPRTGVLEIYDPTTDGWTTGAPMLTPRAYPTAEEIGGKLYVIGGDNNNVILGALEVYDPATNTWTTRASMPTPRTSLVSGVINRRLYAIGGTPTISGPSETGINESYDPATNIWRAEVSMPTARWAATSKVINGSLFVVGGATGRGSGLPLAVTEAFRPQ